MDSINKPADVLQLSGLHAVFSRSAGFVWSVVPSATILQRSLTLYSPLCILTPNGDGPITGKACGNIEITAIIPVAPLATVLDPGALTDQSTCPRKVSIRQRRPAIISCCRVQSPPPRTLNEQLISWKPH